MIQRLALQQLLGDFRRKKILVLLGPRQVGKTTLLTELEHRAVHSTDGSAPLRVKTINCDNEDERRQLMNKTSSELRQLITAYDMVLIDEAQRVNDIGLTLKKIGDLKLDTKVVVTGSSSLDLASGVYEPATGRLIEHRLLPLSLPELAAETSEFEEQRFLEQRMIYGLYPEVVTAPEDARQTLINLTNNYLYKDLLSYQGLKKPDMVQNLVRALALQIGSEVSYNELASLLGIDKVTVESYISLLEKCFIVFRLGSFSRNLRNEIKKGKKIYFYDNGIRNAVLSNFAPLELRNDAGMLWENLMMAERVKRNSYLGSYAQQFFWRTHDQREVDLVEEMDGRLHAYEFKWNERRRAAMPQLFSNTYEGATFNIISRDNFWPFLVR